MTLSYVCRATIIGFHRGETEGQGAAGAGRQARTPVEGGEGQKKRENVEKAAGSTRGSLQQFYPNNHSLLGGGYFYRMSMITMNNNIPLYE